jgi:antitoxin HigA-1
MSISWTIIEGCAMPMKNPTHPGRLLQDDLDDLGLSVAAAAKGLGITRQQLYNVLNGRSSISPEMALRLEKAIGGSADHWLRMQAAYDLTQLRLNGVVRVSRLARKVA